LDLRAGSLNPLLLAAVYHYRRARFRQAFRDGKADPGGGTGYDRRLSVKLNVHGLLGPILETDAAGGGCDSRSERFLTMLVEAGLIQ
jgi:hypothetical protein